MPKAPGIDPIDLHVGQRLRQRRKELNFSQPEVAKPLGFTFQQLQKYERGTNRISASVLFKLAQILDTPVSWFFEGMQANG